jgi:low temperature requirement protein LtrA
MSEPSSCVSIIGSEEQSSSGAEATSPAPPEAAAPAPAAEHQPDAPQSTEQKCESPQPASSTPHELVQLIAIGSNDPIASSTLPNYSTAAQGLCEDPEDPEDSEVSEAYPKTPTTPDTAVLLRAHSEPALTPIGHLVYPGEDQHGLHADPPPHYPDVIPSDDEVTGSGSEVDGKSSPRIHRRHSLVECSSSNPFGLPQTDGFESLVKHGSQTVFTSQQRIQPLPPAVFLRQVSEEDKPLSQSGSTPRSSINAGRNTPSISEADYDVIIEDRRDAANRFLAHDAQDRQLDASTLSLPTVPHEIVPHDAKYHERVRDEKTDVVRQHTHLRREFPVGVAPHQTILPSPTHSLVFDTDGLSAAENLTEPSDDERRMSVSLGSMEYNSIYDGERVHVVDYAHYSVDYHLDELDRQQKESVETMEYLHIRLHMLQKEMKRLERSREYLKKEEQHLNELYEEREEQYRNLVILSSKQEVARACEQLADKLGLDGMIEHEEAELAAAQRATAPSYEMDSLLSGMECSAVTSSTNDGDMDTVESPAKPSHPNDDEVPTRQAQYETSESGSPQRSPLSPKSMSSPNSPIRMASDSSDANVPVHMEVVIRHHLRHVHHHTLRSNLSPRAQPTPAPSLSLPTVFHQLSPIPEKAKFGRNAAGIGQLSNTPPDRHRNRSPKLAPPVSMPHTHWSLTRPFSLEDSDGVGDSDEAEVVLHHSHLYHQQHPDNNQRRGLRRLKGVSSTLLADGHDELSQDNFSSSFDFHHPHDTEHSDSNIRRRNKLSASHSQLTTPEPHMHSYQFVYDDESNSDSDSDISMMKASKAPSELRRYQHLPTFRANKNVKKKETQHFTNEHFGAGDNRIVPLKRKRTSTYLKSAWFRFPHLLQRPFLAAYWRHDGKTDERVLVRDEKARRATWSELFYDVVFAVSFAQLSLEFESDISGYGFAQFLVLFTMVWTIWETSTGYSNRYNTNDLMHALYYFVQISCVYVLTLNLKIDPTASVVAYCIAIAATNILQLWASEVEKRARKLARSHALLDLIRLLPFLISLAFDPDSVDPLWLWGLGSVIGVAIPWVKRFVQPLRIPFTIEHLHERFGLLTIVVVGEQVIAVFASDINQTTETYVAGMLGILMAVSFKTLYHDVQAHVQKKHAMRSSHFKASVWYSSHLPLQLSMEGAAVGVGLVLRSRINEITSPVAYHKFDTSARWVFCGFVSSVIAFTTVLDLTHESFERVYVSQRIRVTVKFVVASTIAALAFWSTLDSLALLGIVTAMCSCLACFDVHASAPNLAVLRDYHKTRMRMMAKSTEMDAERLRREIELERLRERREQYDAVPVADMNSGSSRPRRSPSRVRFADAPAIVAATVESDEATDTGAVELTEIEMDPPFNDRNGTQSQQPQNHMRTHSQTLRAHSLPQLN